SFGEIPVLKTASGQQDALLPDTARDVRDDDGKCIVKLCRNQARVLMGPVFSYDFAHHRLPIDHKCFTGMNAVVVESINGRQAGKFEFHCSLAFKRSLIAYSDERCDSIEQTTYTRCARRAEALLQHLSDHCRFIPVECVCSEDLEQKSNRCSLRTT